MILVLMLPPISAVKRRVLVGDVGIELNARFLAVFEVDMSGEQAAAAGFEVLPVRG